VLLRVEAHNERWDIDDLLSNTVTLKLEERVVRGQENTVPDVSLLDENAGVMNALGETELVNAGLETAL
jgi:hypothetical protein